MKRMLPLPDAATARRALATLFCLGAAAGAQRAEAACVPDPPVANGTVICSGTDSTGFDGSAADNITIETSPAGTVELDDSNPLLDSAILVEDNSTVEIGDNATITVTEANGFGIRGDDDNFIDNQGTIILQADDTRGIRIDQNTTGILPNGAVNGGTIQIDGNRSYGIESGDNSGVATSGTIEVNGDMSRGLSGGDRTDRTKPANVTNSGSILVTGDDGFGMRFGDGWLDGTLQNHDNDAGTPDRLVPSAAGIRNQGSIVVTGARSTGLFVGDDSLVTHSGSITLSGTDSVGISLGASSLFDRFSLNTTSLGASLSLDVSGSISGDADSGPLVVIRDFVADRENRIRVGSAGRIQADLTNQGSVDRAIAIRGSDGDDFILSAGTIRGDMQLGGGDDRYLHLAGATYTGTLTGGSGDDEVILGSSGATSRTFDVSQLAEVEFLRIFGTPPSQFVPNPINTPWQLTNAGSFTGLVEVQDYGILEVPTPISLGGDFAMQDQGVLRVTLDSTTPPLSVAGDASFDGRIEIIQGTNLTPSATPYRVVLVSGTRTGQFDEIEFPDASGTRIFSASYDAMGLLALFQDVGLLGVARTSNQRAIAGHLVDLIAADDSDQDLQDFLDEVTDIQNIAAAYDALSPEAYDAQTTVSVEAGRRIAALLFDRPRECESGEVDRWSPNHRVLPCHARRVAPWVATVGSFRSRDSFSGHNRYDAQVGGLIAGVDFQPVAGFDLTLAVSSQHATVNAARAEDSEFTLAELTGAAAYDLGGLRVQGVVSWGHGFHDDSRRIRFDGASPASTVNVTASEKHESDRTLVASEIGYRIPAGPIGVEPLVGFDWAWMSQEEIDESGAGGFGVELDERDDEIGSVRAGVRLSTVYEHDAYLGPWFEWMTGVWRPTFDVAWRQFVEGEERDLDAQLKGSADTSGGFRIQGEEDPGGAEIGVGLQLVPRDANRLRFDVRYQAYVAEHTLEQDLVGRIAIAF
jgi:uncharacterized protein with beta-barrel porin domain